VRLMATNKKQDYICTVEAGEEGKLAFVYDGKRFSSPSSAGRAIIGTACNGWRFWSIDGHSAAASPKPAGKAKSTAKASTKAAAKPTSRKPRAKAAPTVLHRHDNQSELFEATSARYATPT
jgi:hypothetical protein